jgi:hypothetical protein
MDTIITFDGAEGSLNNPSLLAPRPDFYKLQALRQHIVQALKQLVCPQRPIHGWSGLATDQNVYTPLEPNPFVAPANPGATPIYPQFATPATIKMTDNVFKRDKNYSLSYVNMSQACFRMLGGLVLDHFKVSNTPTLTGWNSTMTVQAILEQLEASYGKPATMTLFANDTLFRSAFPPTDSLEMLFSRIEQCQEIQTLHKICTRLGWHFRQVSGRFRQNSVPAPFFEPFRLQLCAGFLGLFFYL